METKTLGHSTGLRRHRYHTVESKGEATRIKRVKECPQLGSLVDVSLEVEFQIRGPRVGSCPWYHENELRRRTVDRKDP